MKNKLFKELITSAKEAEDHSKKLIELKTTTLTKKLRCVIMNTCGCASCRGEY